MKNTFARILLAEDQADTALIISWTLRKILSGRCTIHHVLDGEEAIQYLVGEGPFADRARYPFPNVVITDLNMPRADGFAVLELLQRNRAWSVIPSIVLTSSNDPDDVRTAYLLGASAYHQKPCHPDELRACLGGIASYWTTCEIPVVDEFGRVEQTCHQGKLGERYPVPGPAEKMQRATPSPPPAS